MEPPTTFEFPARESSPLHPLSPQRVNRRPASTATNRSYKTSEADSQDEPAAQSSPTRKANLFAEYNPITRTPSPSKEVFGGGVQQSPSMPDVASLRSHGRTNSDVQVLVKRFEHLDVRDRDAESEARRKKQEMELRRAQLGREEAESELKKWREECRRIAEDLKESRHRESKVSNRLEKVMDDFRQAKGEYSSNAEAYVKEVRKARKEAFKSASVVLKLQETLRDTQKRLQVSKIDHATDVQKADQFEQEATDAKCALMALQQDLGKLRDQFAVLEQEKEALKANLKEEEVARIAAEGQIALPSTHGDDSDLFSSPQKHFSPRKSQLEPLSDDKENVGVVTKKMFDTRKLQEDLETERLKKVAAEEMVEFLRMECAFKCCECKSAARHGRALQVSMDEILASSIQKMKADIASILTPPASESGQDQMDVENTHTDAGAEESAPRGSRETNTSDEMDHEMGEDASDDAPLPENDQNTTTVVDETSAFIEDETTQTRQSTPENNDRDMVQSLAQHNDDTIESTDSNIQDEEPEVSHHTTTVPLKDSPPSTPPRAQLDSELEDHIQRSVRTITTTTRIPMHFTPVSKPALLPPWEQENTEPRKFSSSSSAAEGTVSTLPFDREAALAAIAYRRGRAKSIANGTLTPPRQMVEGINLKSRRDVSAPVIGTKEYAEKLGSMSAGKALRA